MQLLSFTDDTGWCIDQQVAAVRDCATDWTWKIVNARCPANEVRKYLKGVDCIWFNFWQVFARLSIELPMIRKIPHIVTVHHLCSDQYRLAQKTVVRFARCVCSPCAETAETLMRIGYSREQKIINNCVDTSFFRRDIDSAWRVSRGIEQRVLMIGWAGQFLPRKRIDRLFSAYRSVNSEFPRTKLVLSGVCDFRRLVNPDEIHELRSLSTGCKRMNYIL